MNRSKSLFSKIIAPVAALGLSLGVAAGAGAGLTANAAQFQEAHESGWYVVGNGIGDLKDCSWQEYRADWRLTGTAEDETTNYFGVWKTSELLLYQGDQFKLLYNNGDWEIPDDSGWAPDVCAQYENIADKESGDFADGGLGNIYVNESAFYTFTLTVSEDAETGEVSLAITYTRGDEEVPPITLYDMYVVGTIASHATSDWPDNLTAAGETVAENCIRMTSRAVGTETVWEATVVLGLDDEFKLYNTITGTYYPGGFDNNLTVTEAGTYLISWVENTQEVTLTLQTPVEG